MLFKSKAKKIEDIRAERTYEAKDNIKKIIDEYQDLEIFNAEKIGVNIDFHFPRMYFYYMCNYAEDISALIEKERYSSLYVIFENFLRSYGMCKNLLSYCFEDDKEKYKELVRKYYSASLIQRKDECLWLKEEYFNSAEEEIKFLNVRQNQMESLIRNFFEDYADEYFLEDDKEREDLYELLDKIASKYGQSINQEELLVEAILSNELMTQEEQRMALTTWISGKSASKANIQTVITRILGKKEGHTILILNKHEGIAHIVTTTIEKCLQDIVNTIRQEFDI